MLIYVAILASLGRNVEWVDMSKMSYKSAHGMIYVKIFCGNPFSVIANPSKSYCNMYKQHMGFLPNVAQWRHMAT